MAQFGSTYPNFLGRFFKSVQQCVKMCLCALQDMQRHNRVVHHKQEFLCACALCDNLVFQSYSLLRDHIETHHQSQYKVTGHHWLNSIMFAMFAFL